MMKLLKMFGILAAIVTGVLALFIGVALLVYPPEYVFRTMVWQDSDAFDWQKFPSHPLEAAPKANPFEVRNDPRVPKLFGQLAGAADWDLFLKKNRTQAFIVIQDGKILYENYFNNTRRDSIVTTFSVAKSFDSALIGIAIQEGYIKSINDPITLYLPELAKRDSRFNNITIRHLLLMASGLEYKGFRPLLLNSDDPLTTYFPDQRQLALENTHIIDPPGVYYQYNKYHPQLLGMILERTTGMPVTKYLQTRIWNPLGMEFGGSWSTDSRAGDFEKMETGINARAIDFAKFGVLFLNGGNWHGRQVLSKAWVDESTRPNLPRKYGSGTRAREYYTKWYASLPGKGYYKYMWYGMTRQDGGFDFSAEGDKGQFIYVSPQKHLVIVRNGIEYGIPSAKWLTLFYQFAGRF